MADKSRSYLCQQKRVFQEPMQQYEVVTPRTLMSMAWLSRELRLLRFQLPDLSSIRVCNKSAPQMGGEKTMFFQNYTSFMVTIDSTSELDRPYVILSKTPILVRYYLRLIDFFWICRHSYTPLFPEIFCSMGPLMTKFSSLEAQSAAFDFHSAGGITQIMKRERQNKAGTALLFKKYYLHHSIVVLVEAVHSLHELLEVFEFLGARPQNRAFWYLHLGQLTRHKNKAGSPTLRNQSLPRLLNVSNIINQFLTNLFLLASVSSKQQIGGYGFKFALEGLEELQLKNVKLLQLQQSQLIKPIIKMQVDLTGKRQQHTSSGSQLLSKRKNPRTIDIAKGRLVFYRWWECKGLSENVIICSYKVICGLSNTQKINYSGLYLKRSNQILQGKLKNFQSITLEQSQTTYKWRLILPKSGIYQNTVRYNALEHSCLLSLQPLFSSLKGPRTLSKKPLTSIKAQLYLPVKFFHLALQTGKSQKKETYVGEGKSMQKKVEMHTNLNHIPKNHFTWSSKTYINPSKY